jgi:hypothetical protein
MPGQAHLFLVSTPLNLMTAIAIADTEKHEEAHLVLIDQASPAERNPYFEQAQKLSLFASVRLFQRPPKGGLKGLLAKRKARQQTLRQIKALVETIKPTHIYCGNDRRVEFQYAMHCATQSGLNPQGSYMDDGTFSYVGHQASQGLGDKVFDNAVKKLIYGGWWRQPPTVGASSWVDTAYLAFPELAHPLLQARRVKALTLDYWQSKALRQFSDGLLEHFGRPANLANYDVFFTLPHESIIRADAAYRARITDRIRDKLQQGLAVAVKYHPRDSVADALELAGLQGLEIVSRQIPFEALLPQLKSGLQLIGDFSSTLITARLLRPDITVQAVANQQNKQAAQFADLYQRLGVSILN